METWDLDDIIDYIRKDSSSCDSTSFNNNLYTDYFDSPNDSITIKTEYSPEINENTSQFSSEIEQHEPQSTSVLHDNFQCEPHPIFDPFQIVEGEAFYDDENEETSSSSVESPSKIIDLDAPTKCAVCGEPTNCCHYDVPSCSGCKTFFRRSIVDNRLYTCKYDGKCQITRVNRCRSCRFDKCIVAGMNPSAIQLPENVDVENIIERVNERKRTIVNDLEENLKESETSLAVLQKKSPIFEQTIQMRDLEFLLFLESKIIKMRESNFNPRPLYKLKIGDILTRKTMLKYSDKYEKPKKWPEIIFPKLGRHLLDNKSLPHPPPKHWFIVDMILMIETAKVLPVYEKLDMVDKETLMKEVVLLNTLFMQAYYSVSKHYDTLTMPDGFMPVKNPGHDDFPTEFRNELFCRIIEPLKRINLGYEEYLILKAIMLCNPAIKGITEKSRKLLEKESEKYSKILMKYLQTQYGNAPGAVRYAHIIGIFEAMSHFAQKHKEFHVMVLLKIEETLKEMNKKFIPRLHIFDEAMK